MKKLCLSFGVLCAACLLFCGTALAAEPEVAAEYTGSVTVQETPKGTDRAYTLSRTSGVEEGQLYLALLLKGAEGDTTSTAPLPNRDNVYYMDVKAAASASVEFDVYPKDMEDGTYIVYLSDYSNENAGAAKGVAMIVIGDGGGSSTVLVGDVNGDGEVKPNDRTILARFLAGWDGYDESKVNMQNADINGDGEVKPNDRTILARILANWSGYSLEAYQR